MESVYLLIPLSIVLVAVGVWALFWAVDRGQFEDFEQAERLALEEDRPENSISAAANESPPPRS